MNRDQALAELRRKVEKACAVLSDHGRDAVAGDLEQALDDFERIEKKKRTTLGS